MKILFYNTSDVSETKGGTERITARISTGFTRLGHHCYLAYSEEIDKRYPLTPFEGRINIERNSFEQFLIEHDFDVIILQKMTRMVKELFRSFYKGLSHYHGATEYLKDLVRTVIYPLYKIYYPYRNRDLYRTVYAYSDKVVVLSEAFISEYSEYAHLNKPSKLMAIPNANSYNEWLPEELLKNKKKQVLVVSRLEERQKRISLAIRAWKEIEKNERLKGWMLKIVGDGSSRAAYEQLARDLGLKRVEFVGRQNPKSYYQESAVFMMTSAFEGWGLTQTEAQQMGCVPIAFDSFASVHDIIDNGHNGLLICNNDLPAYSLGLTRLMLNTEERQRMATAALKTSKAFALENVMKEWNNLISNKK